MGPRAQRGTGRTPGNTQDTDARPDETQPLDEPALAPRAQVVVPIQTPEQHDEEQGAEGHQRMPIDAPVEAILLRHRMIRDARRHIHDASLAIGRGHVEVPVGHDRRDQVRIPGGEARGDQGQGDTEEHDRRHATPALARPALLAPEDSRHPRGRSEDSSNLVGWTKPESIR